MKEDMQQTSDIALKVTNVSKSFKLPTEKSSSLKNSLFNLIRGVHGYTIQEVLKDISFEVHKGDFFGIVGQNGSGKSTLLKIISQIYTPNTGSVQVEGKLVPFIELGVGFNPELTGRENVYLNGAMLGFSKDEIDAMYDDIVDFAELGDFMEQKLKNYSSGMQVRFAFSVAIKSQGDILVLDEVLAVGDEAFQKKCQDFFFDAKREKKTIILVTHSMNDVRKYCNKAMLIENGHITKFGKPDEVANAYSNIFLRRQQAEVAAENNEKKLSTSAACELKDIKVVVSDEERQLLDINEDFVVEATLECKRDLQGGVFAINLIDQEGRVSVAASTRSCKGEDIFAKGTHRIRFNIGNTLPYGSFHINIAVAEGYDLVLRQENVYNFGIKKDKEYNQVLMHPHIDVSVL